MLGEAGALAIAYFLIAQLGLSQPSDMAVFWPASGFAAGYLIISGRRAYPALVIGVVVGTAAANLLSDRTLLTSILKGFCNAGEAILVAWLLALGRPEKPEFETATRLSKTTVERACVDRPHARREPLLCYG